MSSEASAAFAMVHDMHILPAISTCAGSPPEIRSKVEHTK